MNTLYPQLQNFTLYSSGAAIGDTSVVLSSMKTIDGVQLSMTNFGDKGFMTLDPSGGSLEEQISFSGLTANANGTTTLSGVKSVLCLSPYTETSGLAKQHSGGATAVVAITSGLLAQFANKGNAETITGVYTFTSTAKAKYNIHPTFSADEEIVDKKYVDDAASAGSPNAAEGVKGLVQLATGAELAAGTTTGTTGARLVPATSSCKSTSVGAGDANKVPVLGADGLLDQTFLDKARTWSATQSFTAASCQVTTDASGGNDAIRKSYMDTQIVSGISQSLGAGTSGEALAIGDAVYIKASDGRIYKTDTDANESTFSFVGICQTTVGSAGLAVNYSRPSGIATGLSGLTIGSNYYLTGSPGVIGLTSGARYARIGLALSTTTLLVRQPTFLSFNVNTVSILAAADAQATTAALSYTKVKEIYINVAGTYHISWSGISQVVSNVFGKVYKNGIAAGTEHEFHGSGGTFTEDLALVEGDLIQLYSYTTNASYPATTYNFRLYGVISWNQVNMN
jgi:hypothetical protein